MIIKYIALVFALLFLSGCTKQQVLYSDLTEREANEMIALLYMAGMSAKKNQQRTQGNKGATYSVVTSKSSLPEALMLLEANDLPRMRFTQLTDVISCDTMVPSPIEQRACINHILTQEMSKTLTSIDGVTEARVHLTLPQKTGLSKTVETSSAAVFIKHRSDINLEGATTKIKALVIDGVENLSYEDVTVVFFAQQALVFPTNKTLKIKHKPASAIQSASVNTMGMLGGSFWVFIGVIFFISLLLSLIRLRRHQLSRKSVARDRRKGISL